MNWLNLLKVGPQYLLPQHLLSSGIHRLANCETQWVKNLLIKGFLALYDVNLDEALEPDPTAYRSFNDFFTRALKPETRPIHGDGHNLVSPADGVISQSQKIQDSVLIQAKCHDYTLEALLGGDISYAEQFRNGNAAVIYLSPRDYHRVHMPCDGTLVSMTYVPGDLFAVNPATVETVPGLFARNERLILRFETAEGPVCLIMVGAIFVGSMQTVWAGKITPPYRPTLQHWDYRAENLAFRQGDEIGRFNMGSTVIVLTPDGQHDGMSALPTPASIKMGEPLELNEDCNDETDHRHH